MVLFYSNEMVKCSWSDSQSSSGDAVYADDEDGRCDERQTRFSVCSKKNACLSHSFIHTETRRTWIIHIWIDFCSLIFTDTSPCRDLMCKDLLLINSSKLRQIPWHSVLNCKYVFYNWIPRFHPRFLHRGNHRAVHVKNRDDRVLGTTGTLKNLVL